MGIPSRAIIFCGCCFSLYQCVARCPHAALITASSSGVYIAIYILTILPILSTVNQKIYTRWFCHASL